MKKLTIGDLCYRRKATVQHVGVYYGNGLIAHNSPDGNAHLSTLKEFADGQTVKVKKHNQCIEPKTLKKRLDQLLDREKSYSVVGYNCEHFASKGLQGSAKSTQLTGAVCGGFFGLIHSLTTKKSLSVGVTAFLGSILPNIFREYDFELTSEYIDALESSIANTF